MGRKRQRSLKSTAISLVILTFALSGCLKPPPPGVSVKAVTADLVFGVPPLPEPVPPPGFEHLEEEEPVASPKPKPPPPKGTKSASAPVDCPKAPEQTFPEEEATTGVKGVPQEGLFPWRWSFNFPQSPDNNIPEDFIAKGVFKVRPTSSTSSIFTVSEFSFTRRSVYLILQEFEVRQENKPDDGIYLRQIQRYEDGDVSKEPQTLLLEPPVMFLPLPVIQGDDISSSGADPNTLAAVRNVGEVKSRQRVDVCGKVIDSWLVQGTQEFISSLDGEVETLTYNYSIATQFGGIIVSEHKEIPRDSPQVILDSRLGRISPISDDVPHQFGGED